MKTVVMVMKTVVVETRCRRSPKYPPNPSFVPVRSLAAFQIFDSPGVKVFQNVLYFKKTIDECSPNLDEIGRRLSYV